MAYMVSANMDMGIKEFQIEAAISKVYASVSFDVFSLFAVNKKDFSRICDLIKCCKNFFALALKPPKNFLASIDFVLDASRFVPVEYLPSKRMSKYTLVFLGVDPYTYFKYF